ncbi:hypothetical protein COM24_05460, partial [Bacillus toyonensis]|uniref:phage tail spike protein n=1 Tax=Bacillus toyonensis TaxID=155322 RepID=UPI000BF81B7A
MSKANNLLHIVDYKTDQIIGVIQEKNYWNDIRQWEIKNNIDQLEFNTMDGTKESTKLMQQNLIVKQTRDGTFVSYVITEAEQDATDRSKKIHALGEHTKLKKATVIKPQTLQATTVNESMDFALQGTEWKRGDTEYSGVRTIHIKDFTNPLDFLKQIASTFEIEIRFRTEILGSFIVGRYVDLVKKVGRDNGKEFLLGKDVQGIRRIESSQDVVTALVGVGPQNSETGEFLTFEDINDGKLYVSNNDALQRWSKDGKHLFDMYSPQTEDQDMTKERLKQLTEAELKKRINSSTLYEVSAVALEKVVGLSHESVRKGDTVRIKDTGFSPPLFLEARLIAADECDTDPSKDKYIFGDYREIADTRNLIDRLYAQIMGSLSNKASKELLDMLDKKLQENVKETEVIRKESEAAKKIAEQVAENLKNNTVDIIEGVNPPTENLKDRKTLWQDISKGKPGILKLWKDGKWDPVVPDVESVKKETLVQVNKDIEATKEELNKKVEEAQKETSGQFKEVTENLQEVSLTIKNVQNSQGEMNKTVSEMKQTNEGFTKSIASLTKKDGEITEKLNTVVETSEGTKKIISEVQQTTNDLKKTTTEITEKAGKISEKLESVEKKVDNTKIGGRNVVLGTSIPASVVGNNTANQTVNIYNFVGGDASSILNKEICVSFDWKIEGTTTPSGTLYMQGSNPYPLIASKITFSPQNLSGKYLGVITISGSTFKSVNMRLDNFTNGAKVTVSNFQIEIGNKATEWTPAPEDQVTNDEFTKRTTEIEKSVDGFKETVTKVENNQSGFDKRFTAAEKNAEGISQNVSKLQEIQTTQGKQLSESQATIKQHSNALEMAVKMKDVEDYVGGIGNQTVLRNVLWKNDTKYWQLTSNAARDTQVTYKGCNSLSVITTGNASSVYKGASHDYINAGPGWNYVFSAYFYTDNKASIDAGAAIELQCYDVNNKMIENYLQEITIAQGTWIRTHVAGLLVEGTKKVKVLFWARKNGRLWMAQPMLQIGEKPSSFMENPVDIVDKDKMIEEIADKVATKDYEKKVTELERSVTANEKGVTILSGKQESFINETYNAYVKKTESRLEVLDEGILAQILKDGIMTSINMSPGKITIDAEKLNINADTIVKWLTAKGIDADVIKISGDKVTIDKNGITAKMADFFFEDERGQKFSVTP